MIYKRIHLWKELLLWGKKETTPAENIVQVMVDAYDPKNTADVQEALKTILGPIFESMLKGKLNCYLGYDSNEHRPKETGNRRNGYTNKTLKSTMGEIPIKSPQNRDGTFSPQVVPKRATDISSIEGNT